MTFVGPIHSDDLNDLVRALLVAAGADIGDARLVAEQLVDAEARESRGQGLIRLRPYVTWMRTGKVISPAKLKLELDSVTGAVPVPARLTDCGLLGPSWVTVSVPVVEPVACGMNVTVMVHVKFGKRMDPQLFA